MSAAPTPTAGRREVRIGDRLVRVDYFDRYGEPLRLTVNVEGEPISVRVGDFRAGSAEEILLDAETGEERQRLSRAERDSWMTRWDEADVLAGGGGVEISAPRSRSRVPHSRSGLRCGRPGMRRVQRPSRAGPCDEGSDPPRPRPAGAR